MTPEPRPLVWIGSSYQDYCEFPDEVHDDLGYRLYRVQIGASNVPGVKPLTEGVLKGLGIMELIDDHDKDTYRVVYTTKLAGLVYVLHAFKKKSKHGIATPQHEILLIRARYEAALRHHRQTCGN